MLNVNMYRRTYVNDVKRERAHAREENRKMTILLNILGSNPLMTMFGPSPQYLTNSIKYAKTFPGADVNCDHIPVFT